LRKCKETVDYSTILKYVNFIYKNTVVWQCTYALPIPWYGCSSSYSNNMHHYLPDGRNHHGSNWDAATEFARMLERWWSTEGANEFAELDFVNNLQEFILQALNLVCWIL